MPNQKNMIKSLRRVHQRDWEHGDCGIACVAMVANVPYEVALNAFRKIDGKESTKSLYTNHQHIEQMLSNLGKKTTRIRFKSWHEIKLHAVVKVNPKKSGGWHWVVYDAGRASPAVHDPKPGKRKIVRDFRGLNGNGYYIAIVD